MNLQEIKELILKNKDKFYVYSILRKDGNPFYIGKGSLYRIQMHEQEATKTNWDNLKLRVIRGLLKKNVQIQYKIVGFYVSEQYALEIEKFLIIYYGRIDKRTGILTNMTDGGDPRNTSDITKKKLSESIKKYIIENPKEYKITQQNATTAKRTKEIRDKYRSSTLLYMKQYPNEYALTKEKTNQTRRLPENRKANSERLKKYFNSPEAKQKNSDAQKLAHEKKRIVKNSSLQLINDNNLTITIPSSGKGIKVFEEFEKYLLTII